MFLRITITFTEDHELKLGKPWPDLVDELRGEIRDDPAAFLSSAGTKRGVVQVKVIPV